MNNFNRLRALVFIRFLGESLFFPFISLFLSGVGFKTHEIGIFIAAIPITSLMCAPIYSIICKTPRQAKISLTAMTIIEPIFVVVLIYSKSFYLSLIAVIFIGIFSSSNYGLLDSLMALSCKKEEKNFSSVRLFGSVSYTIGVLVSSPIIKYLGYVVLFYIAVGLFISSGILYLMIKAPQNIIEKREKVSFKEILSNKLFVGYLIFYILLIGTMQVGDDFFSLYLRSKDSPDYIYSYVMVGFIVVEIIVMSTFRFWYKRLGLLVYFIASVCLVVRLMVQMLPTSSTTILIIFQMLRGVTWGIALSMNTMFIIKLLGFDRSTRGIVIAQFGISIFTAVFKLCGGYIIEMIGYPRFYMILGCLSIFCLIYFIGYFIILKKYNDGKYVIDLYS